MITAILVIAAFAVGIILRNSVLDELRAIERGIHERINSVERDIAAIEATVKGKL